MKESLVSYRNNSWGIIFGVQIKLCLFKIVHFCLLLLSEVYIILKSKKATNSDGIEEKSYPPW